MGRRGCVVAFGSVRPSVCLAGFVSALWKERWTTCNGLIIKNVWERGEMVTVPSSPFIASLPVGCRGLRNGSRPMISPSLWISRRSWWWLVAQLCSPREPYSLSAAVRCVYVRQGRRGPFNQVGDITPRGSFGRLFLRDCQSSLPTNLIQGGGGIWARSFVSGSRQGVGGFVWCG